MQYYYNSFNCLLVISLESTISTYAATTSTTSDAAITTTTVTTIGAYYIKCIDFIKSSSFHDFQQWQYNNNTSIKYNNDVSNINTRYLKHD